MNDSDFDEPDEAAGETQPRGSSAVYEQSSWRPRIAKRVWDRIRLIFAWFRITVIPQYGWRVLASMTLIAFGKLGDAASFVAGTHILTRSLSPTDASVQGIQMGFLWAAGGMAGILALGSILSYVGHKLAAKLVLDYEDHCLVKGLELIRHHEDGHQKLSKQEIANVMRQAPRTMSRSLLYIMNACTSFVMMLVGLAACAILFPGLTATILLSLVVISPAYVLAAIHSTNIGHGIRLNAPGYTALIRSLEKWISLPDFDQSRIVNAIQRNKGYNAYQGAYRARLALPARNQLLSNLTLALVLALSLLWISTETNFRPASIAAMVSYLIALRLFAHGLGGIFHGVQIVNTSIPFYLLFLERDPRLAR